MILATPHLWIPPERPAIVRSADLNGLPHPWSLAEARERAKRGMFPFPCFVPAGNGGNDAFTKILLHLNGANSSTIITDVNAGGSAHTWTNRGTGSIATAVSKFGGASYSCGAAAGWVDTPDSADYTVGSGDFTADLWFYCSGGNATARRMFGQCDSAGATTSINFTAQLSTSNVVLAAICVGGSTISITGTTAFITTGWHHVALVRTGPTGKLFVDGVQEGGNQTVSGSLNDSTNKFAVGRLGEYASQVFYGYLDEFRLSVGIARWTANFTPPIVAYV